MNSELISVCDFFQDDVSYNELKEKLNMHEKIIQKIIIIK